MLQNLLGNKQKALSVIEIMVAIAIISYSFVSILGLTSLSLRSAFLVNENYEANNLAQEAMEQVRNFRDGTLWQADGLGSLTTSTDYYFERIRKG